MDRWRISDNSGQLPDDRANRGGREVKTVRDFLADYNTAHGDGIDDEELIEILIECGEIVHRSNRDQHRWYICETVVAEIDGTCIEYLDYILTGDSSMYDMDLQYDLDSAKIVERKERTVVEVYYQSPDTEKCTGETTDD